MASNNFEGDSVSNYEFKAEWGKAAFSGRGSRGHPFGETQNEAADCRVGEVHDHFESTSDYLCSAYQGELGFRLSEPAGAATDPVKAHQDFMARFVDFLRRSSFVAGSLQASKGNFGSLSKVRGSLAGCALARRSLAGGVGNGKGCCRSAGQSWACLSRLWL